MTANSSATKLRWAAFALKQPPATVPGNAARGSIALFGKNMKTLFITLILALSSSIALYADDSPRIHIVSGAFNSRFWIKAPNPPPDWSAKEHVLWIEYFFPTEGVIVVQPISHQLPQPDSEALVYCFKADSERYNQREISAGRGTHGSPILIARFNQYREFTLAKERIEELRKMIAAHEAKTTSIEEAYLETLSKPKQ